eukprot:m.151172 g.151172  ORF g.151172 m.151172 type:complete len:201 (-) comp14245_c0_seq1:626-1228(-)
MMQQPPPPTEDQVYKREPCPWRIIDDAGAAFAMGAIGGTLFHGIKGYRNAPIGLKVRESINALKLRGPVVGGAFAVWGSLFATFDCSLVAVRGKDDPWNSVASGALTSGLLSVRLGASAVMKSAAAGGFFLMMIEGVGFALNRYLGSQMMPPPQEIAGPLEAPILQPTLKQPVQGQPIQSPTSGYGIEVAGAPVDEFGKE